MNYLPRLRSKSESIKTRDSIFDDLFHELYSLPSSFLSKSGVDLSPRIDISETDTEYRIEAELPGIKQNELDIKIDNNILTLKGEKEEVKEEKRKALSFKGKILRSVSKINLAS
jgi:HSP20 family protein